MSLHEISNGTLADADDVMDNFNFLKVMGTGQFISYSGKSSTSSTFTTVETTDFQTAELNKEVYAFNIFTGIASTNSNDVGTLQLLITFTDNTTTTLAVRDTTGLSSNHYGFISVPYSGTKQIKTIEWQIKIVGSTSATVLLVGSSEQTSDYWLGAPRSYINYNTVGDY